LQGKSKEAIEELKLALRANPDDPSSLHNLAVALAREGRLQDAVTAAERAYAVDPSRAGLRQMLDQLRRELAAARQR